MSSGYDRYRDPKATARARTELFAGRKTAVDEVTQMVVHADVAAARRKYGPRRYTWHIVHGDHTIPVERLAPILESLPV